MNLLPGDYIRYINNNNVKITAIFIREELDTCSSFFPKRKFLLTNFEKSFYWKIQITDHRLKNIEIIRKKPKYKFENIIKLLSEKNII